MRKPQLVSNGLSSDWIKKVGFSLCVPSTVGCCLEFNSLTVKLAFAQGNCINESSKEEGNKW